MSRGRPVVEQEADPLVRAEQRDAEAAGALEEPPAVVVVEHPPRERTRCGVERQRVHLPAGGGVAVAPLLHGVVLLVDVRVDDGVVQQPPGARQAVDQRAGRGELVVVEVLRVVMARSRREHGDGRLGLEEDVAQVPGDVPLRHAGQVGPPARHRAPVQLDDDRHVVRADAVWCEKVRLHVDDQLTARERVGGGRLVARRVRRHVVEPVRELVVEREQARRGRGAPAREQAGREPAPVGGTLDRVGGVRADAKVARRERLRPVLVGAQGPQEHGHHGVVDPGSTHPTDPRSPAHPPFSARRLLSGHRSTCREREGAAS